MLSVGSFLGSFKSLNIQFSYKFYPAKIHFSYKFRTIKIHFSYKIVEHCRVEVAKSKKVAPKGVSAVCKFFLLPLAV